MRIRKGQLCTINRNVFRARKRTAGCEGCYFKDAFFTCPGIYDSKSHSRKIECDALNIILIKL